MIILTVVDAFTPVPFAGNPAAVCVLSSPAPEEWMQNVAREMNLSETAFLVPESDRRYQLRWFTPTVEVALCGHATLASAHALWESVPGSVLEFSTQSGLLCATRLEDGWIRLDFPATQAQPADPPAGLLEALGCQSLWVGRSRFDYLVLVDSEATVRGLQPDHSHLQKLPVRGVMVTAAGSDYDFVSRFFAPGSGVPEDPVTGSAHCALTPFWAQRLGKQRMLAYQASQRGGVLRIEHRGERVWLEGQAVTVSRVQLLHPIALSHECFCTNVAQYAGILEYGRRYAVLICSENEVQVYLPDGRQRRFPAYLFSENAPPQLLRWKLDDEIVDPACSYVEVTCQFDCGRRWLAFATPSYLAHQLPHTGEPCWVQVHLAMVPELGERAIEESLTYLLEQGLLWKHSLPLDDSATSEAGEKSPIQRQS